jgi:hypothetical protein
MSATDKPKWRSAMLLLPLLLLAGCPASLPLSPPRHVEPPAIPPLPATARQPQTPSECLPTCSAGLTKLRESWRQQLTLPASPASSVSVPTKH